MTRCYYFGRWPDHTGHFLYAPGGARVDGRIEHAVTHFNGDAHIDGNLAPRRNKWIRATAHSGLVWGGQGRDSQGRSQIIYGSAEHPQGHFLRHVLDNGFTAIQWWDRCQGDTRGACNSTILLEGEHSTPELLAALREHFPQVLENLERAGVKLIEVLP